MILESKGKISDGFFAIGVPELPAFLLLGPRPTLFDAGMTFMGPLYLSGLKEHLGDPARLRFNFLTHSHFDHCGASPFLRRHIKGLEIGASPLAAETLQKPNAIKLIQSLGRDYELEYRDLIGAEDTTFDALDIDIVLQDGQEVDLGEGRVFRSIATPGHTRDSMCFYIPDMKALITGEAVGVYDQNMTIHPEFLASYKDYLASLHKLASLEIDLIMMSHYFILTGDDARGYLARSIDRTEIFRKRIEQYLDVFHGDREKVVQRIYREDYEETGAILQGARPFLINLEAKVRAVAEGR